MRKACSPNDCPGVPMTGFETAGQQKVSGRQYGTLAGTLDIDAIAENSERSSIVLGSFSGHESGTEGRTHGLKIRPWLSQQASDSSGMFARFSSASEDGKISYSTLIGDLVTSVRGGQ